jgi:diazepam-binding inhibitor (GABA receptor modulator, acyl-CoA-binding protein)
MGQSAPCQKDEPMTDLNQAFATAVETSKELNRRPDNATLLKIYATYKQATEGDNATIKPGFSDLVGRAKWDAWTSLKGQPSAEAKQAYIDLIDSLE